MTDVGVLHGRRCRDFGAAVSERKHSDWVQQRSLNTAQSPERLRLPGFLCLWTSAPLTHCDGRAAEGGIFSGASETCGSIGLTPTAAPQMGDCRHGCIKAI